MSVISTGIFIDLTLKCINFDLFISQNMQVLKGLVVACDRQRDYI